MIKRFIASLLALALPVTPAFALQQASSPPKFLIPWGANAGSAYINSIPVTSQIGVVNCRASLNDGFPPLTFVPSTAGGCPPFGADFNGILKQLSQWSQWQAAGGPVFFDNAFATASGGYPNGAKIASAVTPGTVWMSTADHNTTNPDTAAATNWVQDPGQVPTGMPVQALSITIQPGYVSANGLTIGNASSNATGRANGDTQFLYNFVWNNCPNTICAIFTSTGSVSTRGANPWADFAANKAIAVWNMNGAGITGADSQNGSSSARLFGVPVTFGNYGAPGSLIGENLHLLSAGQIPTITSGGTLSGSSSGTISGSLDAGLPIVNGNVGSGGVGGGGGFGPPGANNHVSGSYSGSAVVSGGMTSNNAGGQSHNTVELSTVVYWNLKL